MIKAEEGEIFGVKYFSGKPIPDQRGSFTKIFCLDWNQELNFQVGEVFYSDSHPGVLRGMHLQVRDSSNDRIISVISGSIFDVLLDLRPSSSTYLQFQKRILSTTENFSVFVPKGVAHGFQALEQSRTLYVSSMPYNPTNDSGINPLSFGIDWPITDSILSDRDQGLPTLSKWLSND
jgi:dTDP-4-dehydrorhamnose 3,5-epimerase